MTERKVEIIDTEVIVLSDSPEDMSGDESYFSFADKSGATHRIKSNRTQSIQTIQGNVGKAIQLNYGEYMGNKFIHFVGLVEGELPPSVEPTLRPEDQKTVDNAVKSTQTIAPQAIGMMTKEIGDMIRAGVEKGSVISVLTAIYGRDAAVEVVKWYRSQTLGITRITYDGSSLPQFIKKEE